jgi:DNA-binding transcriptional regulator LsrR (DeoR family)
MDVARRYYLSHESKVEIARELAISRFKVARLLEEAVDRGAVRITLHTPLQREGALSAQLKSRFGLQHAVVIHAPGNLPDPRLREALAREGAHMLSSLLRDGDVLGVGWGRTIKALVEATSSLPRCPVVQLTGIAGHPGENSMELVRLFAALTGEKAYPLYAPLLVPDIATVHSLRRSPGIADTLRRFSDVSIALVAIGSWNPPNSQLRSFFSQADRDALTRLGLQAELGGVLLDAEGAELRTPISGRILGITPAQLRAIPTVMAVAGGRSKANAIRSVLRSGVLNILVTDTAAAQLILEQD